MSLLSSSTASGVGVFAVYCAGVAWSERASTWKWWQAAAFSAGIMLGATFVTSPTAHTARAHRTQSVSSGFACVSSPSLGGFIPTEPKP